MTTDDQSDSKVCSLNIEAFGHGEDGINLNWKVDDIVDEIRIDKVAGYQYFMRITLVPIY